MRKGFTLIELLIVIGILAILATTVTLVLNPAEILKQSRDAQRISDLRVMRGAIDLYIVRNQSTHVSGATTLNWNDNTDPYECTFGNPQYPTWHVSMSSGPTQKQQPFINPTPPVFPVLSTNPRAVDGTGWVSVNFTDIIGNSPLAKLPLDPLNIFPTGLAMLATPNDLSAQPAAYFYAFQCQGLTYEMDTNMESQKYSFRGDRDVESTDGGTKARFFTSVSPGGFCTDPITPGSSLCDQASYPGLTSTYIADQIYQVGNEPGLNL